VNGAEAEIRARRLVSRSRLIGWDATTRKSNIEREET